MIEVEFKFEVTSSLQRRLQTMFDALPSVRFLGQVDQVDSYYDTQSFACLRQAVFVRIRNQARLEFKYHDQLDPLHTHSTEQVFPLPVDPYRHQEMNALFERFIPAWQHGGNVEEMFASNGFVPFAPLQKRRRQYAYEDCQFCLDVIRNLGHFLELEICCENEQEVINAEARLRAILAQFGLSSLRSINVGYVELWLHRNLPEVYRQGKYQLAEYEPPRQREYSGLVL